MLRKIMITEENKNKLLFNALMEIALDDLLWMDNEINAILKSNNPSFLIEVTGTTKMFMHTLSNHEITTEVLMKTFKTHKKDFSKLFIEYINSYFLKQKNPEEFFIKKYNKYHKQSS